MNAFAIRVESTTWLWALFLPGVTENIARTSSLGGLRVRRPDEVHRRTWRALADARPSITRCGDPGCAAIPLRLSMRLAADAGLPEGRRRDAERNSESSSTLRSRVGGRGVPYKPSRPGALGVGSARSTGSNA
jgi:hypothetical protein